MDADTMMPNLRSPEPGTLPTTDPFTYLEEEDHDYTKEVPGPTALQPLPQQKFTAATRNPCKLCTPLGATLAFRGIEGAVPFLHGSQGCATYIRRYMISHYREPMDIASSSFGESAVIFGGEANLKNGLTNVISQYEPSLVGIATTCLAETIGDDVPQMLNRYREAWATDHPDEKLPHLVHVSTPSYQGTHSEGYYAAVRSLVSQVAEAGDPELHVTLIPGMFSPEDLRYLRDILEDFHYEARIIPDYSDTMDNGIWDDYHRIPEGGTPVKHLQEVGRSRAVLEFGALRPPESTAGAWLHEHQDTENYLLHIPVGVRLTDRFFKQIERLDGIKTPKRYTSERARLIDALVDGHKYVAGKRAVIFGDEDMVLGMAVFAAEIGLVPVLCASGGDGGRLERALRRMVPENVGRHMTVAAGTDFASIEEQIADLKPDILIGNSKGYRIARSLEVPLVRVGFPIHDRIGAQRVLHVGYRGALALYDRIVNGLLEQKQETNRTGYSYL